MVLSPEDLSSEHITKKRTTQFLLEIMEDFHLIAIASRTQKTTYLVQMKQQPNHLLTCPHSILTNLPVMNPTFFSKTTIFIWVQATFGQKSERTHPTLKDYVLGSVEFLLQCHMPLEEKNATCLSMVDEDSLSPPLQDHQWMKKGNPAPATQQGPTFTDNPLINSGSASR